MSDKPRIHHEGSMYVHISEYEALLVEISALRREYDDRLDELSELQADKWIPSKGEPMPQTIEAWQRLYGLAEQAMREQDKTIALLKQRINQLEQGR